MYHQMYHPKSIRKTLESLYPCFGLLGIPIILVTIYLLSK